MITQREIRSGLMKLIIERRELSEIPGICELSYQVCSPYKGGEICLRSIAPILRDRKTSIFDVFTNLIELVFDFS